MLDLQITSIAKRDDTSNVFLENIFYSFTNGIYAIVGKNGAGKSMLLNAIANVISQDIILAGTITYNGTNISQLDSKAANLFYKNNLKYVFQDPVNCFDPLKKVKYYFSNFTLEQINKEFKYFNLDNTNKVLNLYPYELSGGMAQRIIIIHSILLKPNLFLLDEPTSNIDSEVITLLVDRLKSYFQSNPSIILVVTQNVDFAKALTPSIFELNNKTIYTYI